MPLLKCRFHALLSDFAPFLIGGSLALTKKYDSTASILLVGRGKTGQNTLLRRVGNKERNPYIIPTSYSPYPIKSLYYPT